VDYKATRAGRTKVLKSLSKRTTGSERNRASPAVALPIGSNRGSAGLRLLLRLCQRCWSGRLEIAPEAVASIAYHRLFRLAWPPRSRSSRRGSRPLTGPRPPAGSGDQRTLRCGFRRGKVQNHSLRVSSRTNTEKVNPAASLTSKWNYATLARGIIYDPLWQHSGRCFCAPGLHVIHALLLARDRGMGTAGGPPR
jgi:hypothetical protein